MPNPKVNFANRKILSPVIFLVLASEALPADYKVTTVNAYFATGTRIKVLTGTDGVNPSPVTSDLTTEGNQTTQAVDISGTPTLLGLDPTTYATLRTTFNNQKVRIAKAFVEDIDTQLNESTGVVTVQENDVISIGHKVDFSMFLNLVSQQEMQATTSYAKQVDADDDTVAVFEAVIADA